MRNRIKCGLKFLNFNENAIVQSTIHNYKQNNIHTYIYIYMLYIFVNFFLDNIPQLHMVILSNIYVGM